MHEKSKWINVISHWVPGNRFSSFSPWWWWSLIRLYFESYDSWEMKENHNNEDVSLSWGSLIEKGSLLTNDTRAIIEGNGRRYITCIICLLFFFLLSDYCFLLWRFRCLWLRTSFSHIRHHVCQMYFLSFCRIFGHNKRITFLVTNVYTSIINNRNHQTSSSSTMTVLKMEWSSLFLSLSLQMRSKWWRRTRRGSQRFTQQNKEWVSVKLFCWWRDETEGRIHLIFVTWETNKGIQGISWRKEKTQTENGWVSKRRKPCLE